MKPERAGQILAGVLVSLARWEDELGAIRAASGCEVQKRHLMASLQQARQSLGQMIQRDRGGEGRE